MWEETVINNWSGVCTYFNEIHGPRIAAPDILLKKVDVLKGKLSCPFCNWWLCRLCFWVPSIPGLYAETF